MADGVRNHEIAVGQTLHQRARAKAISAVIGKVGFAEHEQARDRAHQIVIHPRPTHRVMDSGIDAHRCAIGIFAGDLLVHVE